MSYGTAVKLHKGFKITKYSARVHCDSQGYYRFKVYFTNGKNGTRQGWIEGEYVVYWTPCMGKRWWHIKLDDVTLAKVRAEIAARFDAFRVYEIDGDGEERFIGLKYHDLERFKALYGEVRS